MTGGINSLAVLYNAKDVASFYSGLWDTGTNPDSAFASVSPYSRLPDRRVLEKFPKSQHDPLLLNDQALLCQGQTQGWGATVEEH